MNAAIVEKMRPFMSATCHLNPCRFPDCIGKSNICNTHGEAVAGLFAEHDRRVTELLEANNREVDRRRDAEEEVAFWRREMLAKLEALTAVFEAAVARGDADRAADLSANHIQPICAAFTAARLKQWHDICGDCGEFIRPNAEYIDLGEDFGRVHAACLPGETHGICREWEPDEAKIIAAAAAAINAAYSDHPAAKRSGGAATQTDQAAIATHLEERYGSDDRAGSARVILEDFIAWAAGQERAAEQ